MQNQIDIAIHFVCIFPIKSDATIPPWRRIGGFLHPALMVHDLLENPTSASSLPILVCNRILSQCISQGNHVQTSWHLRKSCCRKVVEWMRQRTIPKDRQLDSGSNLSELWIMWIRHTYLYLLYITPNTWRTMLFEGSIKYCSAWEQPDPHWSGNKILHSNCDCMQMLTEHGRWDLE